VRLIQLCQQVDGDAYLSGAEGRNYLQQHDFDAAGVDLWFQQVEPPVYSQLHGDFMPYLSLLDVLLNLGGEARDVVLQMGGKVR